jgi:hypothetical protein
MLRQEVKFTVSSKSIEADDLTDMSGSGLDGHGVSASLGGL